MDDKIEEFSSYDLVNLAISLFGQGRRKGIWEGHGWEELELGEHGINK